MSKKLFMKAVGNIDDRILERYFQADDNFTRKTKKNADKKSWITISAMAACLIAVIIFSVLKQDLIEPWIPDGEPWNPIFSDRVKEYPLNAETAGSVFDWQKNDSYGVTNQYTKVYSDKIENLGITPLPVSEYLPIYRANNTNTNKSKLQSFINKYIEPATSLYRITSNSYSIETDEIGGLVMYSASVKDEKSILSFSAFYNYLFFSYGTWSGEDRLQLKGEFISVLASDSDEQIKEKLADTVDYVNAYFNKSYTDIKIVRDYGADQLESINVYLYTPEESIFPENYMDHPMCSEFILLRFYTDWGGGTSYHWNGSKDEAFLVEVQLYETGKEWKDYYNIEGKVRMLSLEEAEKLLKKGYVFGGHSCKLCMALQPEVNFRNYTSVSVEYVFGEDGIAVPFYAFYKYLGKNNYGMQEYAKTYVPAVELEGLDEYFEMQKAEHR